MKKFILLFVALLCGPAHASTFNFFEFQSGPVISLTAALAENTSGQNATVTILTAPSQFDLSLPYQVPVPFPNEIVLDGVISGEFSWTVTNGLDSYDYALFLNDPPNGTKFTLTIISSADPFFSTAYTLDGDLALFGPQTPIPATLPLFATGLGALGLLGWRRKRG